MRQKLSGVYSIPGGSFLGLNMKQDKKKTKSTFSVYLDDKTIEACEYIASAHNLSRNAIINELLNYSIGIYNFIPDFRHSSLQLRSRLNLAFEEKAKARNE